MSCHITKKTSKAFLRILLAIFSFYISQDFYTKMFPLFEHRIVRIAAYTTGAVALSEVIWHGYLFLKRKCGALFQPPDINEVLMFNELTVTDGNSDSAGHHVNRMAALINSAVYCIDVSIYTFTSYTLAEAFLSALRRGVSIRIISDREMVYSSGSQISRLTTNYNIPVRGPVSSCMMHHKFCIIDGEARVSELMRLHKRKIAPRPYRSIVMSGSVNWTKQGFGGNWENCIITSNKSIADQFQEEFDRMWFSFRPVNSKKVKPVF